MEQYIGTKIVEAVPAYRVTDRNGQQYTLEDINLEIEGIGAKVEKGYAVHYPDGYKSWSPKDVFEEAYRPTSGMNFGLAIEAMKKGLKVARRGWNGKNQHIELASAISYKNPEGAVVNVEHEAIGNQAVAFCGTSGVQMGWLASQADMLADDWEVVE